MKKLAGVFAVALALFSAASAFAAAPERALFVSVIQEPPTLTSREEILKLVAFAKAARVRTLFVQVYRENKSWFPSKVADDSSYEEAEKALGEDPFARLLREAHGAGIEVHAWVNLLSLSANRQAPLLEKYGSSILTTNGKPKRDLDDYKVDNQFFLEPSDLRVRKELARLIGEIVARYPALDGIQFDYIRYPDWKPFYGYAPSNVERFKKATGRRRVGEDDKAWKDWRRDQVTDLVKLLRETAKAARPDIQISTTGLMPYSRAFHESFQDWKRWREEGLADFVTLMAYTTDSGAFDLYLADARKQVPSMKGVNLSLGAYKLLASPGEFARQWRLCEESGCRACAVFHYGSLVEEPGLAEPLSETKEAA